MTVDGAPAHLGQKIDVDTARVEVDGVPLPVKPDLAYFLIFKPAGVVSTADDQHGRQTVIDLVPVGPRVYPVGRLDRDSEGLMLLTNDGDLTERLTHPRYGVSKTYVVEVDGAIKRGALRHLTNGVMLDDGEARALSARVLDSSTVSSLVEIVMTEGRKREVRRMLDAVGHPVRRLVRTAIGPLRDTRLRPGSYRELTMGEVRSLYSAGTT